MQEVALSVGLQKFAGKQLAEWLYVRRVTSFDDMTNISLKGRETLKANYSVGRYSPVKEAVSKDGTRKYLFDVGGQFVESVYIPEDDRATLCVSTQAGCKMGCKFCMTGTLGFHGNLSAADIVNQVFEIDQLAQTNDQTSLSNLVLMGEGEPMDNLEHVLRALEIMTSEYGCGWSPKRITVSTVGIPVMKRFLDESDCHIAVSLHNPFPAERSLIMPAEKLFSITDVVSMLRSYDWSHQRRVSFEYICFENNTSLRYAKELLQLLKGLNCRVNLIRFHEGVENIRKSDNMPVFHAAAEKQMEWMRDYLTNNGLTTTIRRSRGEDILAACGMLVNSLKKS